MDRMKKKQIIQQQVAENRYHYLDNILANSRGRIAAAVRARTLAGWMERHPVIWIVFAVVTGIGMAICHIVWGVR